MTEVAEREIQHRFYMPTGLAAKIATALTGMITMFVAYQATIFVPAAGEDAIYQNHLARALTFGALTIWLTLTLGVRHRGMAAVITLLVASFIDISLMNFKGTQVGTIVSANMGIALAWCGMQLYWFEVTKDKRRARKAEKAAASEAVSPASA